VAVGQARVAGDAGDAVVLDQESEAQAHAVREARRGVPGVRAARGWVTARRLQVRRRARVDGGGPPADGPREGREDGDGDGDDWFGNGIHRWVDPLSRCAYAGGRRVRPVSSVCRWAGKRDARGTIVPPHPPV